MGKRIGSLLLCIVLIIGSIAPVSGAQLSEKSVEALLPARQGAGESSGTVERDGQEIQYYYSPEVKNEDGMTDILRIHQSSGEAGGVRFYASSSDVIEKAADTLRSGMVARKSSISISVKIPAGMNSKTAAEAILDKAGEETSRGWEGDYLVYTLGGYRYSAWSQDGKTYNYTFHMNYRTTKAQEDKVSSKVAGVIKSLGITSGTPDYQKIKKIYDYICENTVYDYFHLYLNPYYDLMYTAYAALINRTAVCQGYALLLYRMLREAGIPVRAVTGTSHGEGHMWNIVSLHGTYYNADSTWDAGSRTYSYFLRGNTYFNKDHVRDKEFNTTEYQTSSSDYVLKGNDTVSYKLAAPKLTAASSADYNKIRITWEKVSHAEGYYVYVKSGGKWKKIGETTGNTFTFEANTGVKYTFTVAGYQTSGGKKVPGGYSGEGITGTAVLSPPVIRSVQKTSSGLKLSWKAVSGASSYRVYRYDNGKWVRKKTLKKLSYTDTTAVKGKTCQYCVRACRTVNGKTVYSQQSSAVSGKR